MQAITEYCAQFSARYLDIVKDRLYCDPADGLRRRATQTVLYHHAHTLIRLLAPVMPFTAEDAYDHLPGQRQASVHLDDFPVAAGMANPTQEPLALLWNLRERMAVELEAFRRAKHHTYEARVSLPVNSEERNGSAVFGDELAELLLVGEVNFSQGDRVEIEAIDRPSCPRCWRPDELDDSGLCARCVVAVEG